MKNLIKSYNLFINENYNVLKKEPVRIGIILTILGHSDKLIEQTSNRTWIDMLLHTERDRIGKAEFKDNKWVVNNIIDYTADPVEDRTQLLKGMQLGGRLKNKWNIKAAYLADSGLVVYTEEEELVYIRLTAKQTEITQDAISALSLNSGNYRLELNTLTFHWIELFKSFLKPEMLEQIEMPQNWNELQTNKLGRFGLEVDNNRFMKLNKLLAYLWKNRNKWFNTPKKAEYRWNKIRTEIFEQGIVEDWFNSISSTEQLQEYIDKAKLDTTYWLLSSDSLQLMGPMNGKPRSGNWITKTSSDLGITVSIGFSGEMCGPLKYQIGLI